MAKEILAIPEEHLAEVIRVIRAGLKSNDGRYLNISVETRVQLEKWCAKEESYLKRLEGE